MSLIKNASTYYQSNLNVAVSASMSEFYDGYRGGTILPNSKTYVNRQADEQLYHSLQAGHFCYILTSRQMGKSSLLAKTQQRLQTEGIICAFIDFSILEVQETFSKFCRGIIDSLRRELKLCNPRELRTWLQEYQNLNSIQHLEVFIEEFVLTKITQPIVIMIDEVDGLLNCSFSGDLFFNFIRACYNKRSLQSKYQRLTFVISGVTTPSALTRNKQLTSFNIGKRIDLQGFSLAEAHHLAQGLTAICESPQVALQEILFWTGGQPFLTQKICYLLSISTDYISSGTEKSLIKQFVGDNVITNWETKDDPAHFKTIRDRVLAQNSQYTIPILEKYKQILEPGEVNINEIEVLIQAELKLSGLVIINSGKLQVFNPIYREVFNLNWIEKSLAEQRPYAKTLQAWQESPSPDSDHLLNQESLQNALNWAENRSLAEVDYQFLSASQEKNRKSIQRQSKRTAIEIIVIAVIISILVAFSASLWVKKSVDEVQKERSISLDLESYKLYQKNHNKESKPLERLIKAMNLALELKENKLNTKRPLLALQTILNDINQESKLVINSQKTVIDLQIINHGSQLLIITADQQQTENPVLSNFEIYNLNNSSKPAISLLNQQNLQFSHFHFLADKQKLVTAINKNKANQKKLYVESAVDVWNVTNGHKIIDSIIREQEVVDVKLSPDASKIAVAYRNNAIELFEVNNGESIQLWKTEDTNNITTIEFSKNSELLAIGYEEGELKIIKNFSSKNEQEEIDINLDKKSQISNLEFIPDHKQLAIAYQNGEIELWSLEYLENYNKIVNFQTDHINIKDIQFSQDGKKISTVGIINNTLNVKVWNLAKNQEIQARQNIIAYDMKPQANIINSAIIFNDRQPIVVTLNNILQNTRTNRLSSYNLITQRQLNQQQDYQSRDNYFGQTIVSIPDLEKYCTSINYQSCATIEEIDKQIQLIKISNSQSWQNFLEKETKKAIRHMDLSKNGKIIVTVEEHDTTEVDLNNKKYVIRFWDFEKQIQIRKAVEIDQKIRALRVNDDVNQLITIYENNSIQLWNLDQQNPQPVNLEQFQEEFDIVNFSPQKDKIVARNQNGQIKVWEIATRKNIFEKTIEVQVNDIDFNQDDRNIAIARNDGKLELWTSGQKKLPSFTVDAHSELIYQVRFDPQGKLIATAGVDDFSVPARNSIKIWNLEGQQLQEINTYATTIQEMQFSPDGKELIAIGTDGKVFRQPILELEELIKYGCDWLQNYFVINQGNLKRQKKEVQNACQKY